MMSILSSLLGMQPEAAAEAAAAGDAAAGDPAAAAAAPAAGDAAAAAGDPAAAAAGQAASGGGETVAAWERAVDVDPGSFWMPVQATDQAAGIDWLYYGTVGLSAFWFLVITVAVVYFCIKYRARPGHKAQPSSDHNDALEITWTIVPSIIVVVLFVLGWRNYVDLVTPPRNALEIQVRAQKWNWQFTHSDGTRAITDDELHVPLNTPVRLVMTSSDVLHSFFVPAFRVKMDVIPKRFTTVWFRATRPGTYRLYCSEYCGRDHSLMKTRVTVHPAGGYENYLKAQIERQMDMPPEELGRELYTMRGCLACHTLDGTPSTGPSFKGLYGSEQRMADGQTVTADENYISESILDPMAKIRAGYQPVMPPYAGQLSEKEIEGLIAFIKSLQ
jgi:cytochrome c oxidase subunit II